PHAGTEGLVPHGQRGVLADPVGAVVRVEVDRGLLDQLAHPGTGGSRGDRHGGLLVEPVILTPRQRAQPGHADREVGEGVDDDIVAAEGASQVISVEDVGDHRAAAAALDDGDTRVTAGDTGDLMSRGDERLERLLAENPCGSGDGDAHTGLLRRRIPGSPATMTPRRSILRYRSCAPTPGGSPPRWFP